MSYEKFLGKDVDIFTGFSCERFLGISADFLQNCYLRLFARFPTSKESSRRFSFCKQKLKTIATCPIMHVIKVAIINIREEQQQVLQGFCWENHLFWSFNCPAYHLQLIVLNLLPGHYRIGRLYELLLFFRLHLYWFFIYNSGLFYLGLIG